MLSQKGTKRQLFGINDGGNNRDEVYRFKILLPSGTTVGLSLRDCGSKMPIDQFIRLVKDEYCRVMQLSESMQRKRCIINWNAGSLSLQDANDAKITSVVDFNSFKPHKCHILILHDGSGKVIETFENMWDLTPDTDMLKEVPESYTFESALADLIDNSLQAVWSNRKNDQRLVSVDVSENRISIFDTGTGMDDSDENSIAKWGKIGASLNRSEKEQAIGGNPPYLMPHFGLFGYGGAFASMHLGRHALVCSKTKGSKKVEIFEQNINTLDIFQLQSRLKDIYLPYIQCDEVSNSGKTSTPIEFQVNGTNLTEIEGGEVAITNLHSCNGPDFVLQLHFSFKQDNVTKSSGSRSNQEANVRLKCVYFPVVEAWLPFMDLRHKKGTNKAQLLKRCCLRVKCFIDTDAGINPTSSKTDLAPHSPFTTALRNFDNNLCENEKGIEIRVYRDGKSLNSSQLERDYQNWILQMHMKYDEEVDHGEDEPILALMPSPAKGKMIGMSCDVSRVHQVFKRNGITWKAGQKIKLLKGACAGVYKNNVYATIEYFVLGGFQGDPGGEAQIICRPLGTSDKDGCVLSEVDGMMRFNIKSSMSIPINVIDSKKCLPVESTEWKNQMDKRLQKYPSTIDLLSPKECKELEVGVEELPVIATAGQVPPKDVVAVVRPSNYVSKHDSRALDQRFIFKCNVDMILELKHIDQMKDPQKLNHVYTKRVSPSSDHGIHGLYVFPIGSKFPCLFREAGVYTFSFSLTDSSCKPFVKRVKVKASSEIGKWALLNDEQSQPFSVSVGSTLSPLSIACYDIYDNRAPFPSNPEVVVKLEADEDSVFHVKKFKSNLSTSNLLLKIEGLLIESNDLDKIRPGYKATLVISNSDGKFSVSIPCHVTPGCLNHVKAQQTILADQVLPGCIVKELELEMFDAYGNHVVGGLEVQLDVEGFEMLDQLGPRHKS